MATDGDQPSFEIHRKIFRRKGCFFRLRSSPPQCGANSCQQFLHAKRFDNVVVGARIKRQNLVAFGVANREHQYRHVKRAANLAAGFKSPHAGHVDVQQDRIRCGRPNRLDGFFAGARFVNRVACG